MHSYSALLCIAVHPTCFTIMWGRGGLSSTATSVQYLDATGQRRQCAYHTPATGGEDRANQVDGDY